MQANPPQNNTLQLGHAWCNCWKYCKSVWRQVPNWKYHRHAPFRDGVAGFMAAYDLAQAGPAGVVQQGIPPREHAVTPPGAVQSDEDADDPTGDDGDDKDPSRPAVQSPHPLPVPVPEPLPQPDGPRSPAEPDAPEPGEPAQGEPDPEQGHLEEPDVPQEARRRESREAQAFIQALHQADLASSGLDSETLAHMTAPRQAVENISPHERAGLRMFIAHGDASEGNYTDNRAAFMELHSRYSADEIPTYDQVKKLVGRVSGVHAVLTDMCVNSCLAFTGPFVDFDTCHLCGEARYNMSHLARGKKVPRRQFHTFPLGPQIQAMWASPENAQLMRHRATRTTAIQAQLRADPASAEVLDDVYWGTDYLHEVAQGRIKDDDTVLMFSIDGAQLYASKRSDTWFYIWVLYDLPPGVRYKKRYILPGGVIPGPRKPKNVDSFLFPGLFHLAALQCHGLQIWDAHTDRVFESHPYLLFATADGPGMTYLNGLVGHQGTYGCRLYCGIRSRFKGAGSTYYPVTQKPHDYHVPGSDHPDHSLQTPPPSSRSTVQRYNEALAIIIDSRSEAAYVRNRLNTGIGKPSLFSGLLCILPVPLCFPADLMHLVTLNLTDLFINLLRGTLHCDGTDDKDFWDFACLRDKDVWREHGKVVAESTRYLPGSFDRPPRNPAEKINSGYKAWEFSLYTYGYLPGFLRHLLHPRYYHHFCKLVFAIRILLQYKIPIDQLRIARQRLVEHAEEFETLYVQRRADRMHFVRPSMHATTHMAPEAHRTGPGSLYSQWTMENYIGNITREMKQHVTPYANVSERALARCQVNALMSLYPSLAPVDLPPRGSIDLGDRFRLLRRQERSPHNLTLQLEQHW
ncbi:hypothetical protein TRAPUB_9182 [Trametes pubescens]|uniref:Uncharacterized protein n=1 Tax=Trametes pubescens TaxID=154538 RepID=A0A1M2W324_TRAPU|nr:hypothetical protein TRAPUB_9182 [Trametes pubescens]